MKGIQVPPNADGQYLSLDIEVDDALWMPAYGDTLLCYASLLAKRTSPDVDSWTFLRTSHYVRPAALCHTPPSKSETLSGTLYRVFSAHIVLLAIPIECYFHDQYFPSGHRKARSDR